MRRGIRYDETRWDEMRLGRCMSMVSTACTRWVTAAPCATRKESCSRSPRERDRCPTVSKQSPRVSRRAVHGVVSCNTRSEAGGGVMSALLLSLLPLGCQRCQAHEAMRRGGGASCCFCCCDATTMRRAGDGGDDAVLRR